MKASVKALAFAWILKNIRPEKNAKFPTSFSKIPGLTMTGNCFTSKTQTRNHRITVFTMPENWMELCSIGFDPDDPESIRKALEMIDIYPGEYLTVIGGTWSTGGNDIGENIISDAVVLYQEERDL